jgi:hypothetical protein
MNKLVVLLSALVLILHFPAKAQTATAQRSDHPATATFTRWSLSLETGPSFPVGTFGNRSYYSTDAGYAKTGIGADLAATYHFCPSFGLALSAGFQHNPTATVPYYDEDPALVNQGEAIIIRQSWNMGRLLAGAVYEHALSKNKRLALRIRAMAGVLKTEIPGFKVMAVGEQSGTETVDASWKFSRLSLGFAYLADAGFKYAITQRISLVADAGFAGSNFIGRYSYDLLNPDGSSYYSGKASRPIGLGTIQCRAGIDIPL